MNQQPQVIYGKHFQAQPTLYKEGHKGWRYNSHAQRQ